MFFPFLTFPFLSSRQDPARVPIHRAALIDHGGGSRPHRHAAVPGQRDPNAEGQVAVELVAAGRRLQPAIRAAQ